ncbi:MAG TPA: hypothetical protein VGG20_21610 [Thermoanaerobaculia bacterium]|jgi:hypothetical protein
MSLISDALKKARAEAARQDSLRQGVPYAVGVADAPERRAPWISLLAGLGAGCVLAAAVFALAFFAGWGPFHKPSAETQVAAAPAATVTTAPAAPAPQAPAPATLPAVPPETPQPSLQSPPVAAQPVPEPPRQTAPPVEAPPPAPRNPAPEAPPATPAPTLAPVPTPAAPVEPTPSQPAPAAPAAGSGGLVEGNTYVGEVPVPGGGSVKLNGIVFSPDHPIAVLDGRVMGPGETVQGFTVVAIESGRVKLQGHGATVYLSSK